MMEHMVHLVVWGLSSILATVSVIQSYPNGLLSVNVRSFYELNNISKAFSGVFECVFHRLQE